MQETVSITPYTEDPDLLLIHYPAVLQLLKQRVEKTKDILSWRDYETLIQYGGYTCNLQFHWRYSRGHFHIESVAITPVCKAPPESEQYEF